jgi:hypothetical protein
MPGATLGDMGMWPAREPHPGQQLGNSPAGSLFAAKNGYKMESGHGWETFRGPVRLSLLAAKKKKLRATPIRTMYHNAKMAGTMRCS